MKTLFRDLGLIVCSVAMISACGGDGGGVSENRDPPFLTFNDGPLFVADRVMDDHYGLWRVNPDGTLLSLLAETPVPTSNDQDITNVKISPDRVYLAFMMQDGTGTGYRLYVADMRSADPAFEISGNMVNGGEVSTFEWSPDSSRLAYLADQDVDGTMELYTVQPDGTELTKVNGSLVASGDVFGDFVWSPDSSSIAYRADQDVNTVTELYLAEADGSSFIKLNGVLSPGGDVSLNSVAWAPDGLRIAYMADQEFDGVVELYAVDRDGQNLTKMHTNLDLGFAILSYSWSYDGSYVAMIMGLGPAGDSLVTNTRYGGPGTIIVDDARRYAWSPNSNLLAYIADRDTQGVDEIYTVLPGGTNNTTLNGSLVADGDVFNFQWSPDGSYIAYRADEEINGVSELYTVMPDGTNRNKVSGTLVAGGNVSNFKWSPDSSHLAYRADQAIDGIYELYSVTVNGVTRNRLNGSVAAPGIGNDYLWAPDSSAVVYLAEQDLQLNTELYITQADGTNNISLSGAIVAGGNVEQLYW